MVCRAERGWWTKSQTSLLNIYFRLSGFQSSLLFIHFRYGPNITSLHCTDQSEATKNLSDMWLSTLEISAAQLCSVTEIAPNSPFLCVYRSPNRYGFRAGAKATWYSATSSSQWYWLSILYLFYGVSGAPWEASINFTASEGRKRDHALSHFSATSPRSPLIMTVIYIHESPLSKTPLINKVSIKRQLVLFRSTSNKWLWQTMQTIFSFLGWTVMVLMITVSLPCHVIPSKLLSQALNSFFKVDYLPRQI